MQILNLIRPEKSDVKYEVIQFPDGEPHIVLNGIDRKDDLTVVCRICNPTYLFILMQVGDILNRQGILFGLDIVYLKGALQRYGGDPNSDVICSKVRDPKTGQLSGFKIENPEVIEKNVNLPFVVIDDLCDGGGTFKGITTLSENYKEVYFTNSYKDWNKETLPDNVKVIEIV